MIFRAEAEYADAIDAAAERNGLPGWVIRATIAKESGYDPAAFRPDDQGGSRGLMQMTMPAAATIGYTGPAGDDSTRTGGLYDPERSIELGARYLAWNRDRFAGEPWDVIYAAYNAGSVIRDATGQLANEAYVVPWRQLAWQYWADQTGAMVPPEPIFSSQAPDGSPAVASGTLELAGFGLVPAIAIGLLLFFAYRDRGKT
jgi:soluble lytic murein transglycosylase-like protein